MTSRRITAESLYGALLSADPSVRLAAQNQVNALHVVAQKGDARAREVLARLESFFQPTARTSMGAGKAPFDLVELARRAKIPSPFSTNLTPIAAERFSPDVWHQTSPTQKNVQPVASSLQPPSPSPEQVAAYQAYQAAAMQWMQMQQQPQQQNPSTSPQPQVQLPSRDPSSPPSRRAREERRDEASSSTDSAVPLPTATSPDSVQGEDPFVKARKDYAAKMAMEKAGSEGEL